MDGFTDPRGGNRFSLGLFSNVQRDSSSAHYRRLIGRGIRLAYRGQEVYAECISERSVFIQLPGETDRVYRLSPGMSMKVFDDEAFVHALAEKIDQVSLWSEGRGEEERPTEREKRNGAQLYTWVENFPKCCSGIYFFQVNVFLSLLRCS